uniref:Uncharacterized protein n=1 Tax=Oryza glumipatula TaxID=40148 RepID=A0A0E0AA36_9ORYZ
MAEAQQEVAAAAKGYRSSPSSPSSMSPTPSPPPAAAVHGGEGRAEEATTIAATATPTARSLAAGDNGTQVSGHGEHAGLSSGRRRGRPKGSGRRQILANLGQYIAVHPRTLAMASGSGVGAGLPLEELGLDGAVLDALWRCAAAATPPPSRLCSTARKKKGKRKEERERERGSRAPGCRRASSPSAVNPGDAPPPPPRCGRRHASAPLRGRRGKEKKREKNNVKGSGLWDISSNQPSAIASLNPKVLRSLKKQPVSFSEGAIFSISFSKDNPFLLAVGGQKGNLKVSTQFHI